MGNKKLFRFCLISLVCIGLMGSAIAGFAAEKVVKIGVIGPFTGPAARVGAEIKNAYRMGFKDISYKIGDYEVKLVWIDSEGDPEKASRAYIEAAVREGIAATTFDWYSGVGVALMDLTARYKIPHFFGGGATDLINQKYESDPEKYQYWEEGKFWPIPQKLCKAYVEAIEGVIKRGMWKLKPEEKRVAVYTDTKGWGLTFVKAIAQYFEEAGWKVVSEDHFPTEETEFYPLLTKLKSKNVKVVAGTISSPAGFASLIKQAGEVGLKSLIIADGLGWIGEWYELTGNASNYVLDEIPQWTTKKAKVFRDRYKKEWGREPSASSAGLGYDGAGFMIEILRTAYDLYGELNSKTIHKVGHELVAKGRLTYRDGILMKEYKYTPETCPDPVVGKEYFIYPVIQYFNGKGTLIWPEEWAEGAQLQIPDYLK